MTDRPIVPAVILPPKIGTPVKATKRSSLGRLSTKVQAALDAMAWDGKSRTEAAALAGMSVSGLGKALRKPLARAYYEEQCEALRVSGKASRIHRLEAIAAQDSNQMAAVGAIKTLEQMEPAEGVARTRPGAQTPGVVIIIGTDPIGPRAVHDA